MKVYSSKFVVLIFVFFTTSCSPKTELETIGSIDLTYISDRDVLLKVYLVSNSDFNNPQMISNERWDETSAVWSNDGTKLAIVSIGVRNSFLVSDIDILDIETMESSTLVTDERLFSDLDWSPDEKQFLFSSNKVYENEMYSDIFVMDINGSEMINLTNSHSVDSDPMWSPDGSKIVFVSERNGYTELFMMNIDGTHQNSISTISQLPSWIAECQSIYGPNAQNSSEENSEYYLELPYGCMLDNDPAWSPDGSKIAFVSARDGNKEIYMMNVNGTGLINISNHTADDDNPSWSPDGSKIIFASNRDGDYYQIFIMNIDGSDVIQVTSDYGNKYSPAWRPTLSE
jgi:Tol biopolymer transport system component